jgi:hypothetical protein
VGLAQAQTGGLGCPPTTHSLVTIWRRVVGDHCFVLLFLLLPSLMLLLSALTIVFFFFARAVGLL